MIKKYFYKVSTQAYMSYLTLLRQNPGVTTLAGIWKYQECRKKLLLGGKETPPTQLYGVHRRRVIGTIWAHINQRK